MNDTAAKGPNFKLTSSASSSSLSYRQHIPLTSSWFVRHNSRSKNRAAASMATSAPPPPPPLTIPLSILSRANDISGSASTVQQTPAFAHPPHQNDLQPPSPLSPPPPHPWLSLDTQFGDDEDHPMDFRLECDSVCETTSANSLDAVSIETLTIQGDDRTVTSSEGDGSTIRVLSSPTQQLSDFSNFLNLQTVATQDSASTIRRTVGSRHSNHTDDTATASFIFGSSQLSHTTTLEHDDPDAYGWEAELEHRKSNVASAVPRSSAIDLRRVSSSSSNSVFSMNSDAAEHHKRQRGGSLVRRQSFFQRMFNGKPGKDKDSSPLDTQSAPIPFAAKPARSLTAPQPSAATATSSRPVSPPSISPIPNMPALSLLLGNLSTLRESNRL